MGWQDDQIVTQQAPSSAMPWMNDPEVAPVDLNALKAHANSLDYQMAIAGAKHQRPAFKDYAAQSLKEMVIPAITTTAGATLGPLGAMVGGGTGELMNQAMGISGGSVIPEANVDKGRIAIATLAPGVIPGIVGAGRAIKGAYGKAADLVHKSVEPLTEVGRDAILRRYRSALMNNDVNTIGKVIQATSGAKELVAGSKPTVAEAISHIPSATGIAAYEKKIGKMEGLSGAFADRRAKQELARSSAIQGIAKTPRELEQAIALRSRVAETLYQKAFPQLIEQDKAFGTLMSRPSMQTVMRRAEELAREKGDVFKVGQDIAEQIVKSPIVSASGQPIERTIPAEVSKLPVKSLHYMKMAMDDLIKSPERFGIGANEANAIAATQKDFVKWIGEKSPVYDLARESYKALSVEPNRMQVGQQLQKALDSPLEAVGGMTIPQSERAAVLAKAVQDAPRTIKNATGRTMFDSLDEILDPSQMHTVGAVTKDLARHQAANKLAAQTQLAGSDAIPGNVGLHLPPMLSRPAMVANWALGKLGQDAETRIATKAAAEHLNPRQFAESIRDLPGILLRRPMPTRSQLIIDAILRKQAPFAAVTSTEMQRQ